jgi:hypothetical protein
VGTLSRITAGRLRGCAATRSVIITPSTGSNSGFSVLSSGLKMNAP